VTILLHRRLSDPRIRATSKTSDIVLLVLLWLQLRSAWPRCRCRRSTWTAR
jgi:nitrate reductase gamma subunit